MLKSTAASRLYADSGPRRLAAARGRAVAGGACCLAGLALLAGCGDPVADTGGGASSAGAAAEAISWTHFDVPARRPATEESEALGAQVFADNCAACHGDLGDSNGLCAAFLSPAPRDFTTGVYRFKMTPGGQMPTDEDLFRTVSLGVQSTGMPPWMFLLSEEERWAAVDHLKSLSPEFESRGAGEPVDLGPEPETTAERVANGERLYTVAQCGKCHGDQGYGDGPSALTLVDSFGDFIPPRNFHKFGHFKRGYTLRDVALTIHTGNNGTPMPAFDEAFTADEIWDIAIYVMSLAEESMSGAGTPAAATAGEELGTPDVVINLMERNWKYLPDVIRVQQGQIVRVDFQPTDNGLGVGHGFAIDGYDQAAFINGALVQRPKSVTFLADKAGEFTFYCASQCSTGPLHPNMNGTLVVEPASQN